MIDDMINGGVFGMIRSGKTTLARKLCWHYWRHKQQPALVLDPKNEWWPECCTVFRDLTPAGVEQFWTAVLVERKLRRDLRRSGRDDPAGS